MTTATVVRQATGAATRLALAEAAHRDLIAQRDAIAADITNIKLQLDEARGKARESGVFADSEWYARASYALRKKSREHQRLQQDVGEAARAVRRMRHGQIERCFVDAARVELDYETFKRVWTVAEQMSAERIGDAT